MSRPDPSAWPLVAASIACFRDGAALIARRSRGSNAGLWSLPGGGVVFGERAEDAALRELYEETGVRAGVIGLAEMVEVIDRREDGTVSRHAVILAFAGLWTSGEPAPGEEADAFAWVLPDALDAYATTPGLAAVVRKAAEMAA